MNENITVPLDVLNVVLAVILPMLTALVTARLASSAIKSVVLLGLTVLATALQALFDTGGTFEIDQFLITTTLQFIMAVGLHFGLLKPAALTGANGKVALSVPAGIGGPKATRWAP